MSRFYPQLSTILCHLSTFSYHFTHSYLYIAIEWDLFSHIFGIYGLHRLLLLFFYDLGYLVQITYAVPYEIW